MHRSSGHRPQPLSAPPAGLALLSARPSEMLLLIARQTGVGDPAGCAAMLALVAASQTLRARLHAALSQFRLNAPRFDVLVSLYALDPEPATPAELAALSGVRRATLGAALRGMVAEHWIDAAASSARTRAKRIRLTARGRTLVERAAGPFLATLAACAAPLDPTARHALALSCAHLSRSLAPDGARQAS